MKGLNKKKMLLVLIISIIVIACNKPIAFSPEDMLLSKCFTRENTVVYESQSGSVDTIMFSRAIIDTLHFNNFEQGFYDEYRLKVYYMLTEGSYHQFLNRKVGNGYNQLLSIVISGSHNSKEFCFLGLLFDETFLKKLPLADSEIVFTNKAANYSGLNINKSISSFKFESTNGIISFIDENGILWTKKE